MAGEEQRPAQSCLREGISTRWRKRQRGRRRRPRRRPKRQSSGWRRPSYTWRTSSTGFALCCPVLKTDPMFGEQRLMNGQNNGYQIHPRLKWILWKVRRQWVRPTWEDSSPLEDIVNVLYHDPLDILQLGVERAQVPSTSVVRVRLLGLLDVRVWKKGVILQVTSTNICQNLRERGK